MKRRDWHRPLRRRTPGLAALPALWLCCALSLLASTCLASEPLVLKQNDARILKFAKMTRVWVTDPAIIDVVVAGYNELLVYSKGIGFTKLYVWDSQGRHEYSVEVKRLPTTDQVVRELQAVLGRAFQYRIVDDKTVFVEGVVETPGEKERVTKVVEATTGTVKVVDLVKVVSVVTTPAEAYRRAFEKLFPGQFTYTAIDEKTLVIEGEVATAAEKKRLTSVLDAATGIKSVDLVRCLESVLTPNQQRIESIKQAVGDAYRYQAFEDQILVISGEAGSEAERQRVEKIVTAAAGELTVVNAVAVKTDDRSPAVKYAELLKPVFGPGYTFTPVGENGLLVEGSPANPGEEARVKQTLDLLKGSVQIVSLVSTGGARSAGERAQAMLKDSLGDQYTVRVVAGDVVLVEGQAATGSERQRVTKILAAVPADTKVVDLVATGATDDTRPAARFQEALRPVLGENLTYRVLDDDTLLVEGELATAGDKARADTIIASVGDGKGILNLLTVKPGPGAAEQSAASRKAKAISQILGDTYKVSAVDDKTVVVQGVAPGDAEQKRISAVLDKVAGDISIVNMITSSRDVESKTPAERSIEGLRKVVPPTLTLVALDAKTVLIEGVVPTNIEKESMDKVAEIAAKSGEVNVLSLVLSEMQSKTPAARRIEGLKKILGDQYNYIVWDDETVLVDGKARDQAELDRVRKILEAANKDWKVGDLVTYEAGTPDGGGLEIPVTPAVDPMETLVGDISRAIGEPYRVWHLKGKKLVVEGAAPNEAALQRVQALLKAYSEDADIVDLVAVAPTPTISAEARAEALRAAIDPALQVRTLQGKAVVVDGTVPTKADAERARTLITAMGNDVPVVDLITVADPAKRQIVAHVQILDINEGGSKKLGVDWGNIVAGDQEGTVTFGDQPFLMQVYRGVDKVGNFGANLRALKQSNQARILAEPNLVTNDGQDAELVVGGEVPIPVPQVGTGTSAITIEYKQYGVVLRIKPTILADGSSIQLDVEPEVSSVDTSTQISIGGIAVPAFRTRRAHTIVDLPTGSALLLGGLIQHDQSKVVRSIPFLGKLPILGELFRSTDWQQTRSELVIVVMPEILQPNPKP
jgi:Flp pilus assembly secretin CpaC